MDSAREVRAVTAPAPKWRAWRDWLLSFAWVLLAVPLLIGAAVLEGFMWGEHEQE